MTTAFETATQLAGKIRRKELSARELAELYIDRIERHDGRLNAVVVRDFERALAAADGADAALARGELRGPLHGVPMTIKEAYDIEGLPTTWGVPPFKDNVASEDSVPVERLKAAGAVFLGKTNVPLNLADFQSYNDIYGTTSNPWNPERIPGGSSGGSAASLAAGFTGLEAGSDIGGSIRNPSHFCGVYGHKPTWGVVCSKGHALPGMVAEPDIAVVGPMARSAEDLALALDVMAGAGPLDGRGWQLALPRPPKRALSELRVALWPTHEDAPVSTPVADRVQALGDRLAKLGATVSDAARPALDVRRSFETYLYMLNGVMAAGIPDEIFAGMQAQAAKLDPSDDSQATAQIRSSVQTHREWSRRNHFRMGLRHVWRAFFDDWDILLCPISATTAFAHDHRPFGERTLRVDETDRPYFQQLFWAGLTTVAYLPSTVFPTGVADDGLPIGLQAVGAEYDDHTCIEFARLMAEEIGGFTPPPGYDE